MAVTTQNSYEYSNSSILDSVALNGNLRVSFFNFVQSGDGDANSLVNLVKLPAGRVRVLVNLSVVFHSAFGSGRTLDIGVKSFTRTDGTISPVSENAFQSAADVSAAGFFHPENGPAVSGGIYVELDSKEGVTIQAKCEGDTIPAGTILNGYFIYVA